MDTENEEYLRMKLEWVKLRLNILDEIEVRLNEMKKIAIIAEGNDLSGAEREALNKRIHVLENEISELDKKSRAFWLDCQ